MVPHVGFENETGEESMVQSKENASIRAIPHSWNQFRGPDRDGVIPDQGLPIAWDQKPSPLWKVPCGLGHTSITANENSVFTIEQMDGEECRFAVRVYPSIQRIGRVIPKVQGKRLGDLWFSLQPIWRAGTRHGK